MHSEPRRADSSRRWWACAVCDEVVPGRVRVEYGCGAAIIPPEWRCAGCLTALYEEERTPGLDVTERMWGIRVLKTQGEIDVIEPWRAA